MRVDVERGRETGRATYNIKGFLQKQKKNAAKKIKKKTTLAVTNQCIPIYSVAAA